MRADLERGQASAREPHQKQPRKVQAAAEPATPTQEHRAFIPRPYEHVRERARCRGSEARAAQGWCPRVLFLDFSFCALQSHTDLVVCRCRCLRCCSPGSSYGLSEKELTRASWGALRCADLAESECTRLCLCGSLRTSAKAKSRSRSCLRCDGLPEEEARRGLAPARALAPHPDLNSPVHIASCHLAIVMLLQ